MNVKIPCFVLIYWDFEIIHAALNNLARQRDMLDLYVIENKSEHTQEKISPFIHDLIKDGVVEKYFLFDENISNNALEVVMDDHRHLYEESEFVLITDGDLQAKTQTWLEEEIFILRAHPNISACSVQLSDENLPLNNFPQAKDWLHVQPEHEYFMEGASGLHLVLMKTDAMLEFVKYRRYRKARWMDANLDLFIISKLNKQWVRTKKSKAIHLTWNRYLDAAHEYFKIRAAKTFDQTWRHYNYCGYTIYSRQGWNRYVPVMKKFIGHYNRMKGLIELVSRHVIKRIVPLALWNSGRRYWERIS